MVTLTQARHSRYSVCTRGDHKSILREEMSVRVRTSGSGTGTFYISPLENLFTEKLDPMLIPHTCQKA